MSDYASRRYERDAAERQRQTVAAVSARRSEAGVFRVRRKLEFKLEFAIDTDKLEWYKLLRE